jgi:hypothetical protein
VTSVLPSRRGPDLPYSLVAGVTPCGPSWLVASAKLYGTHFAPEDPQLVSPFSEVLDMKPTYSIIALNAPIGYLDLAKTGGRTCDREARTLLGKRGSSIQSAPVRSSTNELEFLPDHLDAISMTLLPRYREVAAEMAPFRQRTVYEHSRCRAPRCVTVPPARRGRVHVDGPTGLRSRRGSSSGRCRVG